MHFEQVYKAKEFNILELCCLKIAAKLNRGNYTDWKNSDYIYLSAQLKKETKVYISENTLKRIFGKLATSEEYTPQKATRDALALYIGYRDWEEFVKVENTNRKAYQHLPEPATVNSTANATPDTPSKSPKYMYGFIAAFVLLVSFFVFTYKNSQEDISIDVQLMNLHPTGYSPHSAMFKLKNNSEEVFDLTDFRMDFDNWRSRYRKWHDSIITFYYEKPGVYYPKLYYKDKVIDTQRVVLNSAGWEVTCRMEHDTTRMYPIAQGGTDLFTPPSISLKDVHRAGVDTMRTFFTHFSNVQPFNQSADQLSIEAFIKTSPIRPGVRCSQVDLKLYGEESTHYFVLIKPECISWADYKFSENYKGGRNQNLESFGHDLREGKKVRLTIINKKVTIYVDDKPVFKTQYEKPIGQLLGIDFMFSGVGEIKDVKLSS